MKLTSLLQFVFFGGPEKILVAGMDLLRGGGFRGGGCYFHDQPEKYERHNEIHVIVMICHTVSEYHV